MRSIQKILKIVYKKRFEQQSEVEAFFLFLKENNERFSEPLKNIARNISQVSYVKKILTITIPRKLISPEIHFYKNELENSFRKEKDKDIKKIIILPEK